MATVDEEGVVTVLGRGSQCINTGGEKVYPEEVEQALKSHPDVYDALVAGVPDATVGQPCGGRGAAARRARRRRRWRTSRATAAPGSRATRSRAQLVFTDRIQRSPERQGGLPLGAGGGGGGGRVTVDPGPCD